MNTSERINLNYQFWNLLGPSVIFIVVALAYISPFHGSNQLALATIIGLPLCWRWKIRGMLAAIVLSFITFAALYNQLPQSEKIFHLSFVTTMTIGFIIFTLSLEEGTALETLLRAELAEKKKHVDKLKQTLSSIETERHLEKKHFDEKYNEWVEEFDLVSSQLKSSENLIVTLKSELIEAVNYKEKLLGECLQKRKEIENLQLQLNEANAEISSLEGTSKIHYDEMIASQMQVMKLQENMDLQYHQMEELKLMVKSAHDEARLCHEQVHALTEEAEQAKSLADNKIPQIQLNYEQTISLLHEKQESLEIDKTDLENNLNRIQSEMVALRISEEENKTKLAESYSKILELNEKLAKKEIQVISEQRAESPVNLEDVVKEKNLAESLLKQLRGQFEEKNEVLAQTRTDLFHTQEKLDALLRVKEEMEKFGGDPYSRKLEQALFTELQEKENQSEEIRILEQIVTGLIRS